MNSESSRTRTNSRARFDIRKVILFTRGTLLVVGLVSLGIELSAPFFHLGERGLRNAHNEEMKTLPQKLQKDLGLLQNTSLVEIDHVTESVPENQNLKASLQTAQEKLERSTPKKDRESQGEEPEFPYKLDCPDDDLPLGDYTVTLAYHVGMVKNWKTIVEDQIHTLTECGLGKAASEFILSYSGGDLESLNKVLRPSGLFLADKTKVVESTKQPWEGLAMNAVHAHCASKSTPNNTIVFYFHNKGASKHGPDWRSKLDQPWSYSRSLYWRKYMEYFTLERPALCLDKILNQGYGTCGIMLKNEPWKHYSGNFWVASCNYLRALSPINMAQNSAYVAAEKWVGTNVDPLRNGKKAASLHDLNFSTYKYLALPEDYSGSHDVSSGSWTSTRSVHSFSTRAGFATLSKLNVHQLAVTRIHGRHSSRRPATDYVRLFSSSKAEIEISLASHDTVPLQDYTQQNVLDPRLLKALRAQGIETPTPIQAHGIPLLQKGCNVMASSRTGSGKTLLFALPICDRLIDARQNSKGPSALILNPTRELALQTASTIKELTAQLKGQPNVKVALATGGANVKQQRQQAQQCDVLVATPGRLLQFLDDRSLSLNAIQDVICDESDRMVDLGFEPQLRRIAQNLRRRNSLDRRTVLCSATFPPEVQRVAADFLKADYYFIAVGKVGATHSGIQKKLLWAGDGGPNQRRNQAIQEIQSFLKKTTPPPNNRKSFCFAIPKTKPRTLVKPSNNAFPKTSVRVATGDKTQQERNRFLEAFRQKRVDIVAARGLDVPTIGLVDEFARFARA